MKIYTKLIKDTKYSNISDFIPFPKGKACYIDIETTGFNRKKDMIYLIGLIYEEDKQMILTQYLCQKPEDEYELLYKLNTFLKDFDYLVHFNGDSFDLPFIKERMNLYRIEEGISSMESYDFYRKLKPLKRIIRTDNFKLKTMEAICGYDRIDPFTGGELIALYKEYLNGDPSLESSFIIHNEEDMVGLYHLNKLLPLIHLSVNDFDSYFNQMNAYLEISENNAKDWTIYMPLSSTCPIYTFNISDGYLHAELSEFGLIISSTYEIGEKKLFFLDYRDYYYLPEEDTAIHSSIASFMSPKYRKKATPSTAYIRRYDTYMKIPANRTLIQSINDIIHVFSDNYKDDFSYILVQDFQKYWFQLLPLFIQHLL